MGVEVPQKIHEKVSNERFSENVQPPTPNRCNSIDSMHLSANFMSSPSASFGVTTGPAVHLEHLSGHFVH